MVVDILVKNPPPRLQSRGFSKFAQTIGSKRQYFLWWLKDQNEQEDHRSNQQTEDQDGNDQAQRSSQEADDQTENATNQANDQSKKTTNDPNNEFYQGYHRKLLSFTLPDQLPGPGVQMQFEIRIQRTITVRPHPSKIQP
jgi:hypothetical protein